AVELKVDRMKVLKMLIVHDLPEIITGDIPVCDKLEMAEQAAADEEAALEEITAKYHMGTEIAALCREFEATKTNEAKLARAIDKAEALIQHNNAPMDSWDQNDYDYQTNFGHPNRHYFDVDPFLQALRQQIDADTMAKIDAAGTLDQANTDAVNAYREGKR
ncbi:MAG: HD domain-containing protein, partial [Chloroflexota bacterium]